MPDSGISWSISVLPLADRVADLIRENEGRPTPEFAAVCRGMAIDRRYVTFGRRTANLLVLIPVVAWGLVSAIVGPAASAILGIPIALVLAAAASSALLGFLGKSALDTARAIRDPVAQGLATAMRWVVEGRGGRLNR